MEGQEEKNLGGRPVTWTEELKQSAFEKIIDRISNGESLRSILQNADRTEYPSFPNFYKWLSENEGFDKQYVRACEVRAEIMFDEMIEIADDGSNDYMTVTRGDITYEQENREVTNRSKLRIDSRKWILSKMNPKKYGDKVDLTTNGHNLGATFERELLD